MSWSLREGSRVIRGFSLTTGDIAAHTPSGNPWCANTFGMAQTVGLKTLESQLLDPGGTVPFPYPVPRPVPITKNDRTDNPTPQVLEESQKTSVQSGGLEGKILRRSLIPKARMQQKTTVPKAKKPSQTQKPTDGGFASSVTVRPNSGPKEVSRKKYADGRPNSTPMVRRKQKYADGTPKVRRWYAEKVRRKDEEVGLKRP